MAQPYFLSDLLTEADFWKNVSGDFTTDSATKLLLLRIQQFLREAPSEANSGSMIFVW